MFDGAKRSNTGGDRDQAVPELILLSGNRKRSAAKRAAELAALGDDEDDWANNFRAHHLIIAVKN